MKKLLETMLIRGSRKPVYRPGIITRMPELPVGFVSRTDPNFFFLAHKFQ